jgi:hypothetical protein
MKYRRQQMRRVDKSTGLRSDYRVVLTGVQAALDYGHSRYQEDCRHVFPGGR